MKNKILIVIPFYNCEKQIVRVLKKIFLLNLKNIAEIVLIDNCSVDNSLRDALLLLKKNKEEKESGIIKKIKVFKNNNNYGLGGTFKLAALYSRQKKFDYFVFFHGDDQASVEDLVRIISKIKKNNSIDVILGARFMKKSHLIGYSKIRIFGNLFFNYIFSVVLQKKIYDIGSGLNLYKSIVFDDLFLSKLPSHIAFDADLLLLLMKEKINISFFPINWRESDQISNANNIKTSILLCFSIFRYLLDLYNKNENSIKLSTNDQCFEQVFP